MGSGDHGWVGRWMRSVFGAALGVPGWLGFPSLAPESLGSEPRIPAGSSPLSAVT